jgi:hypothetical protein
MLSAVACVPPSCVMTATLDAATHTTPTSNSLSRPLTRSLSPFIIWLAPLPIQVRVEAAQPERLELGRRCDSESALCLLPAA